jgi:iron only hydrogenase large subunit-like protein
MEQPFFYHALKVDEDLCVGCSHCINVCPTEAIRVWNGKAQIDDDQCIDCGQCYTACPVNAICVEDDSLDKIWEYKYRVALIPAVLIGQFSEEVKATRVYSILHELGFTHVFEIERAVEFLREMVHQYQDETDQELPLISSFCPAVVRLIQVKFPSLVDNIMRLGTPSDISAMYIRKKLLDEGVPANEIGIFYITPCAAKIAAIKSPVGEKKSVVTGAINLNVIYNKIRKELKKSTITDCIIPESTVLKDFEVMWTLTRGEANEAKGKGLAIDGIHNAMEFLEMVENEDIPDIDFLECRACMEGCAGGVLNPENRFLTVERLKSRVERNRKKENVLHSNELDKYKPYLSSKAVLGELIPRSMMMLDTDMGKALRKMEKAQKILKQLPGIDCGACGAPSCRALSEDIVKGNATLSHCVFVQKVLMRKGEINMDTAFAILDKIWGEDRVWKGTIKDVNDK